MKKVLALILAVCMVLTLCACGQQAAAEDNSKKVALICNVGGLGDKSFNDSGYAGLEKAQKELGTEFTVVEPEDVSQGETYLRQFADAGYGAVITLEYSHADYLKEIPNEYPNTVFVATDQEVDNDKALSIIFDYHQSSYLAGYAASLLSSTGTPAYFLHGTEAVHGSCGQLVPGDIVIFISNSGETAEMKATVTAVRNNGCKVIGISGNAASWLAGQSEVHLLAHAEQEGGPLNRAPRASIVAELLVLQALSVLLQSDAAVTPTQYVKWHPGGSLGHLRENER